MLQLPKFRACLGNCKQSPRCVWCGGGHVHKDCPDKGKEASTPNCCYCKLSERENHAHPITAAQPREGRATTEKGRESSGKDFTWESIFFEAHNATNLLRGSCSRKSAVAVISAAAATTAKTDLFRQARGRDV
jgi:hypothetical protein